MPVVPLRLELAHPLELGVNEPVRSWIPWSLLGLLTALAATGAFVGAKTDRGRPLHLNLLSPFYTPAGTLKTTPTAAPTALPPQAGYRDIENFCAVEPVKGTIRYDGTSGRLTGDLTVSVSGLPPNSAVNVNWSNDHVRAPVIGAFETDSHGTSVQSSVVLSRLGEVRGVEIVLTAATVPSPVLGRLEPC